MPKKTTLTKSLKYSVKTTCINFDPQKYYPRTIVVNGQIALRIKDNIYTKL